MQLHARDVLRVTGLTYHQLDHSFRSGLLRLTGFAGGSGVPRRFRLRDVLALAVLREVLRAGIPTSVAAPALRLVQYGGKLPPLDQLAGTTVWMDGRAARVVSPGEPSSAPPGVVRYVVDLGAVAERVNERLQELAAA